MEKGSANAAHFVEYLHTVKPKKTRKPPMLSGHTVTVSLAYQRYHFNEMLYLAQMIVNAGGRYTLVTILPSFVSPAQSGYFSRIPARLVP